MKISVRSSSIFGVFTRMRWVAVVGALSVCLSGCSFLFSRTPEKARGADPYEPSSYHCSSYAWPVLDTTWAALNALGMANAAASNQGEWEEKNPGLSQTTVIVSGLLWMTISGISAAYGYTVTSKCNEAKEQEDDAAPIPSSARRSLPTTTARPRAASAPALAPVED